MNNHIVINIRPFVFKQEVCVYEDGACIRIDECTMDQLGESIMALAKQYNISQVDIAGFRPYAIKVQNSLMTEYGDNSGLNVTVY